MINYYLFKIGIWLIARNFPVIVKYEVNEGAGITFSCCSVHQRLMEERIAQKYFILN